MENKTETGTGPLTLEDRLKMATERKDPGKATTASTVNNTGTENTTPKPETKTTSKAPWNSDEDFAPEQKPSTTTTEPTKPAIKITDKTHRASARTVVGMVDILQKGIFTPLINVKYKKKFKDVDVNELERIMDANKGTLTEEEQTKRNKWEKIFAQRDKKIAAIPIQGEEKEDMTEMWYNYFVTTEQVIPPLVGVVFVSLNSVVKRGIDLATD